MSDLPSSSRVSTGLICGKKEACSSLARLIAIAAFWVMLGAAPAAFGQVTPMPGDPLSGNGSVSRTVNTYSSLMSTAETSAPVDDTGGFGIPSNAAPPANSFQGTLTLSAVKTTGKFTDIYDPLEYNEATSNWQHLPPTGNPNTATTLTIQFVQNGSWLIPVTQGLVYTNPGAVLISGAGSTESQWNIIVGPGRAWTESSDNGYSRASFPFALSENNQNCIHNGEMTFLFNSAKSPTISNVIYQITQETCEYWQFNMWGTLTASYTAQTISGATTLENNMATEITNRLPSKPFASLATDYPSSGINLSQFTSGYASGTVTQYGVYINGINYYGPCTTRYGDYAFCSEMRLPSYSTAKSSFVETALSRLGEQFGSGTYSLLLKNYVPQYTDGGTWTNTTLQNMSDMASGNYDSSGFETDEDSTDENDFIAAGSYCCGTTAPGTGTGSSKVYQAFDLFKMNSTTPGTLWVYHTHDSFLLTSAMQAYVQANISSSSDIFTKTATDVYAPLNVSQGGLTMMRTSDQTTLCTPGSGAVGCPVGGYGMFFIADDIAKLGNFFNNAGGIINGVQVQDPARENDTMMRTSNLGLVTPDSGFYSGTPPVANTYHYHNEFWDKYWTTTEFPSDGFNCQFWVPFLSGYGGISVILLPDGGVYYIFTQSGDFYWDNAVIQLNTIVPMCGQGIHSPTPNSSLTSTSATFQWYPYNSATMSATVPTAISTAQAYWLDVGPTQGSNSYYSQAAGTALQATVTGLPTNGSAIWARWWYETGGSWTYLDYSYNAAGGVPSGDSSAAMTSPTPGTTLSGTSVAFTWSAGTGPTAYSLNVGSTAGGGQYFSQNEGTSTTATVSGLPANGSTVYVTLYSEINGYWVNNSYTYTAYSGAGSGAMMSSPTPTSVLTGSSVTFSWTSGTGVSLYDLDIGSSAGGNQYYSQQTGSLSAAVSGLPTNGSTVYVTLYSEIGGTWYSNPYTYTAATSTLAVMQSPTPSTMLTGSSVAFTWSTGSGVTQYYLDIGSSAGGNQYYSQSEGTNTTATVGGLPVNGSTVYVTLYSYINSQWQSNAYTYTAFNPSAAAAVISSPGSGSTLTGSSVMFTWNSVAGAQAYWLDLGSSTGGNQYYSQNQGTGLSVTVGGLPTDGSQVYSTLYTEFSGTWYSTSASYTAATSAAAVISTPSPGSPLAGASQTFTWTTGSGVTQYSLDAGSTSGGNQYYSQNEGTNTSATVTGLPVDGSTVYVTLWSLINGSWTSNTYTFTAALPATMTSPANGSSTTGGSATFTWSTGTSVTNYYIDIGSTPGGNDVYSASQGTNTTATISVPTNGETIYVTLYSLIGGTYYNTQTSYTAGP
jgi:hypothetical protein